MSLNFNYWVSISNRCMVIYIFIFEIAFAFFELIFNIFIYFFCCCCCLFKGIFDWSAVLMMNAVDVQQIYFKTFCSVLYQAIWLWSCQLIFKVKTSCCELYSSFNNKTKSWCVFKISLVRWNILKTSHELLIDCIVLKLFFLCFFRKTFFSL